MLNGAIAAGLMPEEFVARMRAYPFAVALWAVNYYLFTVLVEYLWFRRRIAEQLAELGKPLLKGIVLANLVSYAVLGPLYWWQAQPRHSIKEFTHHTRWARQPAADIAFVNSAGSLSAIRTDGSNLRPLLTNQVSDFVISEDMRTILFRNGSNEYYIGHSGQVQRMNVPAVEVLGPGMDFSPDGSLAALLPHESATLYIWGQESNVAAPISISILGGNYTRICWSTNRDSFFLLVGKVIYEATITNLVQPSCELKQIGTNGLPPGLPRHYARLGQRIRSRQGRAEVSFDFLRINDEEVWSMMRYFAGGGIDARHRNKRIQVFENPGLFHFGQRHFREVGFTASYDELVFHDGKCLYLADMDQQRVGRIAPGSDFVLFAPMFSKADAPQW